MLAIIIIALIWWLTGFCIYAYTLWSISPELTVGDLLCSAIAGLVGPLALFWYLLYAKKTWMDRKIIGK